MATEEITTLDVNTTAAGDKRLTIDADGNLVLTDQPFEHQITDAEINENSETPSLVKGSQLLANDTFDGLSSAVAFVSAYPDKLISITTSSEKTAAECATAGIQYPDGKGDNYVIVGAGTEADDGVNFINAGTKQLKLERNKGGQRLISLVDKKTSLRMATAANKKYESAITPTNKNVRLYLDSNIAIKVDTGVRMIEDPKNHIDASFTILTAPTIESTTLASQNITSAFGSREFQSYYSLGSDSLNVIIGGVLRTISTVGGLIGKWRIRYSGGHNILTITKNGVSIYQDVFAGGTSSEPTATTTLLARRDGSLTTYADGSNCVMSDISILANTRPVIVLGASIMDGAFTGPVKSTKYLHDIGSSLDRLREYATPGDTIADTIAALPAILAFETSPSLFVMHIGGNDVTGTRPYWSAPVNRLDDLENGLREIISTVKAAGHDFALASITYRNYFNILLDGSDGSLPYNTEIIEPLIRELTPEWWDFETDRPVLDLYQWAFDNQNLMQGDGVHYTAAGYDALREHILDLLSSNYTKNNGGYRINLNGGGIALEQFTDFNGSVSEATMIGTTSSDWYAGMNGVNINGLAVKTEGVGSQLPLKNTSGAGMWPDSLVPGTSLSQTYFNAGGLLTVNSDPLPIGSMWRILSGGFFDVNETRILQRIS